MRCNLIDVRQYFLRGNRTNMPTNQIYITFFLYYASSVCILSSSSRSLLYLTISLAYLLFKIEQSIKYDNNAETDSQKTLSAYRKRFH